MKQRTMSVVLLLVFILSYTAPPVWAEPAGNSLIANDFSKSTTKNTTLNFTARDFTQNTTLPEGNTLSHITLSQLPAAETGTLRLGTNAVAQDAAIVTTQLDQLNFVPAKDFEGQTAFRWIAHVGTNESSPAPATVTITVSGDAPPAPTKVPDLTPTQKPLQYEDMLEHWGAYSAGMLGAEGLIVGEEIGGHFYFYPDKVLTRIDFIILANSIFGIKTKDSLADNPFTDVGVPSFMLRQAIAAYENGLITGSQEGGGLLLHPFETLTRAEAAKILDNGLKLEHPATEELSFADADVIPLWAVQAIRNMEAYGIIKGYDDNTFRPYANVNKAQAGELLYQVFKYREKVRKTKSVFNEVFYGNP